MTTSRYLVGVVLLVVTVTPVVIGARELRSWLLPDWSGAPAWMADVVITMAILLGVAQVLGTVDLFRLVPLVLGCVGAGLASARLSRRGRRPPGASALAPAPPVGRLALLLACASGALVLAAWSSPVATAFDQGMATPDTVWQHLPTAARFVQNGSIRHFLYTDSEPFNVFYPWHSSLLHAEGILLFGSDVLSPLINLGWLAFALLSAWCVGRPAGVGAACVVGVALVFGSPCLVGSQPGGAYNDTMVIALVLATLGLLANGGVRLESVALGGVAAGLALGTKFTAVPTVAALTFGVVALAPKCSRVRFAGIWLAALVLAGGFWYARNLVLTGSPLPAFNIDLGLFALPSVHELTTPRETVAEYLGNSDVRNGLIRPALEFNFGPAWWAILGLSLLGMVASLISRDAFGRMLGLVGIASFVAYLYTPLILGTEGFPYLFKFNIRYVTLALVIGLVAFARRPGLGGAVLRWPVLFGFGLLLVITQSDDPFWRTAHPEIGVVVGAAALLVAVIQLGPRPARVPRAFRLVAASALIAAAVVEGAVIHHDYLRDRYTRAAALRFQLSPMGSYWEWAQHVDHARIAIIGDFLVYPLYGRDLTNRVEYMGHHGPHGAFSPIVSCSEWRRALNDGGFQYVITTPLPNDPPGPPPPEVWTRSDPAARPIQSNAVAMAGNATLFQLSGPLHPAACPRPRKTLTTRGGRQLIRLRSGREIAVQPRSVAGYLETVGANEGSVTVAGWAADPRLRRPATLIFVLKEGRALAVGSPSELRPDIAQRFGQSARKSGFKLNVVDPRGAELTDPGRLRIFAVSHGRAAELPRLRPPDE